jgi:hypothetical protein
MARGDAARSATGAIVTGARERRAMAVRVVLFKTTRISSPPTSTSAAATDAVQHNAQPEQFKTTRVSNHEVFATFTGLSTVPQTVASIFSQVQAVKHVAFPLYSHGHGCRFHVVRVRMVGRLFTAAGTIRYKRTSGCGRGGPAAAGACRVRPSPGLPGEVPWAVEWAGARSRAAGDPTGETVGHRAAATIADPYTACRRRSTDKQETSDFYLFRTE